MESLIADYFDKLVDPFINPQKRVFIGYLVASIIAAIVLSYFLSGAKFRVTLATFFARRVWWSKSARADYMIAAINQALMMGVMQRLVSKLAVATILFEAMHVWFDGRPELLPEASELVIGGLFTLTLFVFDDAAKYADTNGGDHG